MPFIPTVERKDGKDMLGWINDHPKTAIRSWPTVGRRLFRDGAALPGNRLIEVPEEPNSGHEITDTTLIANYRGIDCEGSISDGHLELRAQTAKP